MDVTEYRGFGNRCLHEQVYSTSYCNNTPIVPEANRTVTFTKL